MSAQVIRVDGSYINLRPASYVPRTVHVRHDLLVDLDADGRVIGVERVGAAVTAEDLAAVLFSLPFEPTPKPAPTDKSWIEMEDTDG